MTQHQPVPQSAPKSAAKSGQPGWSYLAHKLLQRLQDHEDLPDPDADATDDPARMPDPTPPALTSHTLLTGLRLAASFGNQAAVNAAITPNAITLLRGATVAEVAHNLAALRATRERAPDDPPHLDEIGGDSTALRAARAMVADLRLWRAGTLGWHDLSRTVLFHGPPGTGKSWMAQAMARSAGFAAIPASFGEWQAAGHLGDMLKAMRASFAEARRRAPAMLILDELDAVGTRADRGPHQNYRVMVINAFLALMDGIARDEGVVVVATCNHPDLIDPTVLRPGRFDLALAVPLPDAAALAGVLRRHMSLPDPEIRELAQRAIGHSMADLDAALRGLRGEARRAGRPLTSDDLRAAFGADDEPAMTRRIAIHECGHALVTAALGHGQIQHIALDRAGGQTRIRRAPRAGLIADHSDLLAELMAGRAAERLVFGTVTSGAGGPDDSDLALATRLALALETRFGLGAEGPLWLGEATDWLQDKAIRHRLRDRLEAAEAQALAILTPHRTLLEDMAQTLATRRELSGQEAEGWLEQVRTGEGVAAAHAPESGPSWVDPAFPSTTPPD